MTGLEPILDKDTRVLILGTFPGAASLQAREYYADPRNTFWRLLSQVLAEELPKDYLGRKGRLRAHCIGLWDVVSACDRKGSSDRAIRNAKPTDFVDLRQRCPSLELICFNGKAAGKFEPQFRLANFKTLVLPSSSSAFARSLEQKVAAWQAILTD